MLTMLISACGGDGGVQPGPGEGGGGGTSTVTAPSGLAAEAVSGSRILLTWSDNSGNETGFRVERSSDGSTWGLAGETAADTTAFEDVGLEQDTRYVYRVRAEVGRETSAWSATADATTLAGDYGVFREFERTIEDVLPAAGTPVEERNLFRELQAVAEALAPLAGVDTVLVWDQTLTVQTVLDNGMTHLFVHNRPPVLQDLEAAPSPEAGASPAAWAPPAESDGPPGSKKAVVAAVDGGDGVADEVAEMLSAKGYEVSRAASLVAMRTQYTDLGALYLDTHGTSWGVIDANGVYVDDTYGLQTSTELGPDVTSLRDELIGGDIVMKSVQTDEGLVTKFAVTRQFIAAHWSFDDAIVMIHSCYGGSGPFSQGGADLDPSALGAAMLGNGAEVYASFDNLTVASYARPSILFFWDRLLGADTWDRQAPPLRPFGIPEVRGAMARAGLLSFFRPGYTNSLLGIELGGNDVNVTFQAGGDRASAAPSVRAVDVVDDVAQGAGQLTLHGLFGTDRGEVEVAGGPVNVTSWREDRVEARVPFDGFGSTGEIVVKSPDDVESNRVPLTEWRGTVTARTEIQSTAIAEAQVDFRFRADVHRFRSSPDAEPEHRVVTAYLNPASSGTSRGSGSYTDDSGNTVDLSGSYDLRILTKAEIDAGLQGPPNTSELGARIVLDPEAGHADICPVIWGQADVTAHSPQGSHTETRVMVFGQAPLLTGQGGGDAPPGCARVGLDPQTFVIEAFTASFGNDDVNYILRWGPMLPSSPPDEGTAG